MAIQNKPVKIKQLKNDILKEVNFIKSIFAFYSAPNPHKENDSNMDIEITNDNQQNGTIEVSKRAHSIAELEEKLEKVKSQQNFNLKTKLMKKSLTSKLNKKIKKKERVKVNKTKVKEMIVKHENNEKEEKPNVNQPKPVFNTEGKLVFSKFDFADLGKREKKQKMQKDPKKILDDLKQQENMVKELKQKDETKAKEIKEKIAWKNILHKAEGQKVKDDPILLKKSIKKQEQKKKSSKKQWENRIKSVEEKKEERQKKRKENILKKKKEKKAKVVKASAKRGRVVI